MQRNASRRSVVLLLSLACAASAGRDGSHQALDLRAEAPGALLEGAASAAELAKPDRRLLGARAAQAHEGLGGSGAGVKNPELRDLKMELGDWARQFERDLDELRGDMERGQLDTQGLFHRLQKQFLDITGGMKSMARRMEELESKVDEGKKDIDRAKADTLDAAKVWVKGQLSAMRGNISEMVAEASEPKDDPLLLEDLERAKADTLDAAKVWVSGQLSAMRGNISKKDDTLLLEVSGQLSAMRGNISKMVAEASEPKDFTLLLREQAASGDQVAAEALGRLGDAVYSEVYTFRLLRKGGQKEVAIALMDLAMGTTVPALAEKAVRAIVEAERTDYLDLLHNLVASKIAMPLRVFAVWGFEKLFQKDKDRRVCRDAATALGGVLAAAEGLALQQGLEALVKGFSERGDPGDAAFSVRGAAAAGLGRFSADAKWPMQQQAVAVLTKALAEDEDWKLRREIVKVLVELGAGAEEPVKQRVTDAPAKAMLAKAMPEDKYHEVPRDAAGALRKLGATAEGPLLQQIVEALAKAVRDEGLDHDVRRTAIESLVEFGPATQLVAETLTKALAEDGNNLSLVRKLSETLSELGATGPALQPVIEGLALALADRSADVRIAAAETLSKLGASADAPGQQRAAEVLAKVLAGNSDRDSRRAAARALGKLGASAEAPAQQLAAEALAKAFKGDRNWDRNKDVREDVVEALNKLGASAEAPAQKLVAEALIKAFYYCGSRCRAYEAVAEGLRALGKRGGAGLRRPVQRLTQDLKDGQHYDAYWAARALGELGPGAEAAVPALEEAVKKNSGFFGNGEIYQAARAALQEIREG